MIGFNKNRILFIIFIVESVITNILLHIDGYYKSILAYTIIFLMFN